MAGWDEVRARAVSLGSPFDRREAHKVVLDKFHPDKFLLSHCTIIASVDTETPQLPLGRQVVDGFQIDRKYADYFVTPETSKYINNNNDCWERNLLLACFRTFIGGENYVEHLQIPELSKGKIIDAAARDIGDSVYVDILVATDMKHRPLITAVQTKQLQTLSMGCQVAFTTCTKCGNVAEDETQLCPHIRYMKGNTFIDGLGKTRKIAELCGHVKAEPGSVKFIEASWVANPAFTGAVLRNILTPEEAEAYGKRVQVAFSQPTRVADPSLMQRAAHGAEPQHGKVLPRPFVTPTSSGRGVGLPENWEEQVRETSAFFGSPTNTRTPNFGVGTPKSAFSFGDDGEAFEGEGDVGKPKPEKDPVEEAVEQMADLIKEKALGKVRDQIQKKDLPPANLDENRNDTLIKEALRKSPLWKTIAKTVVANVKNPAVSKRILVALIRHKSGGWNAVRQASLNLSGPELMLVSRFIDRLSGVVRTAGEDRVYRTVMAVGGMAAYSDEDSYLAACRRVVGRQLTGSERDALVTKGRIYDLGVS